MYYLGLEALGNLQLENEADHNVSSTGVKGGRPLTGARAWRVKSPYLARHRDLVNLEYAL